MCNDNIRLSGPTHGGQAAVYIYSVPSVVEGRQITDRTADTCSVPADKLIYSRVLIIIIPWSERGTSYCYVKVGVDVGIYT